MKKMLAVMMAVAMVAGVVCAAYDDDISAHDTGYVLIPLTNTVVCQNLVTGTVYMCFALSDQASLTEAQAAPSGGSSSWKQLVYSMVKTWYTDYDGQDSTNKPTKMVLTETVQGGSGANVTINHGVQSIKSIDSGTVVSE